jgi:hypothetical protein
MAVVLVLIIASKYEIFRAAIMVRQIIYAPFFLSLPSAK